MQSSVFVAVTAAVCSYLIASTTGFSLDTCNKLSWYSSGCVGGERRIRGFTSRNVLVTAKNIPRRSTLLLDNLIKTGSSTEKRTNTKKFTEGAAKKPTNVPQKANNVPQKMIRLLAKMISNNKFPGSTEFQYDVTQIDEKILKYKINLSIPDIDTGFLLLRIAICAGRRDVCRLLVKHGASQLGEDKNGTALLSPLLFFSTPYCIPL